MKAVFYDLDDTLVLTSEADKKACMEVVTLIKQLQIQVETNRLVKDWHKRFVAAPWDPTLQVPVAEWRAEHWAAALADQGCRQKGLAAKLQAQFDSSRIRMFRFEPGVKEMVEDFRATGLKAIIITNGHAEIQRSKLAACQAADLFDGMLVGGEEVLAGRQEKPHPAIFLAACKLAGCQPHEDGRQVEEAAMLRESAEMGSGEWQAVHIGDNLATDIAGAANAGLKAAIWVNRDGRPLPPSAPIPHHTVAHVTDLRGVLRRLTPDAPW